MHPKRVSQRVTPPPTHTLFGMEVSQASRLLCVCLGVGVCVPTSIATGSERVTATTIYTLTQRPSARFRRESGVRRRWSERLGSVWSGNGRWILQGLSEILMLFFTIFGS